jgi:hypothetical protein
MILNEKIALEKIEEMEAKLSQLMKFMQKSMPRRLKRVRFKGYRV